MLRSNTKIGVEVKCVEEQTTQVELAEKSGASPSCMNRLIRSPEGIINKTFVQMLEQLGYDTEFNYIKKQGGSQKTQTLLQKYRERII